MAFFFKSSDSRRLERVQEKGLRADYKDKHPTYESLLQKPKLPTLLNRHNLSPLNICNIFHEQKSSYSLRQSDFSFPRYNAITYGKHSLHYLDPTLWSKLTTADRSVTSLPSFKDISRRSIFKIGSKDEGNGNNDARKQ